MEWGYHRITRLHSRPTHQAIRGSISDAGTQAPSPKSLLSILVAFNYHPNSAWFEGASNHHHPSVPGLISQEHGTWETNDKRSWAGATHSKTHMEAGTSASFKMSGINRSYARLCYRSTEFSWNRSELGVSNQRLLLLHFYLALPAESSEQYTCSLLLASQ